MKPYFDNIAEKIIVELDKAEHQILVAVAWVSNIKIIDILAKKSRQGVKVDIFISTKIFSEKHKEQQDAYLKYLSLCKCRVYKIGEDTEFAPLMHHKFCVIDNHVLITGSYNWTEKASTNFEDIIIINDFDVAQQYVDRFKELNEKISNERRWFNNLSLFWQETFKKLIEIKNEPTQHDLKSILALTKVDISTPPFCLRQESAEEFFNSFIASVENPTEEDIEITKSIASHKFRAADDLSPLTALTNLQNLNCSGTSIKTLEPLINLINLEILDISFIENVTLELQYLKNLRSLKLLNCSYTQIVNFDTIKALNIEGINLEGHTKDTIK